MSGFTGVDCRTADCPSGCTGDHKVCRFYDSCECEANLYYEDLLGDCQPICGDCNDPHASCTSPGVCECLSGYTLIGGICTPTCTTPCALNETCIAPDVCGCKPGYRRSGEACVSNCTTECEAHQECVTYGTGDSECVCEHGYHLNLTVCEPICMSCKNNEICVDHDVCVCASGYHDENGDCVPTCSAEACANKLHSQCTAPMTCECATGWSGEFCNIPICVDLCVHSQNVWCNHTQGSITCAPCLAGWSGSTCNIPDCSMCTFNATCDIPNSCYCLSGFYFNSLHQCVPACENCSGIHSQCLAPDVCQCDDGFDRNGEGKCVRVCNPVCGLLERCDIENGCVCTWGYEFNVTSGNCTTQCPPLGCVANQHCANEIVDWILTSICKCNDGFLEIVNGTCVPVCYPICGLYEQCNEERLCECALGYNRVNGTCEPVCISLPQHATCVAPGTWACSDGYVAPDCLERCQDSVDTCDNSFRACQSSLGSCIDEKIVCVDNLSQCDYVNNILGQNLTECLSENCNTTTIATECNTTTLECNCTSLNASLLTCQNLTAELIQREISSRSGVTTTTSVIISSVTVVAIVALAIPVFFSGGSSGLIGLGASKLN